MQPCAGASTAATQRSTMGAESCPVSRQLSMLPSLCTRAVPQGGDVGRCMVVLITDGRANVSLAKSNEDPEALAPDAPKPSADQVQSGGSAKAGVQPRSKLSAHSGC